MIRNDLPASPRLEMNPMPRPSAGAVVAPWFKQDGGRCAEPDA
jgi:hypothetical protein